MPFYENIRAWGIGKLVALVVLILCIVLWFIGKPLSPAEVLGLIATLSIAILLV